MKKFAYVILLMLTAFTFNATLASNVPFDNVDIALTTLFDDDNTEEITLENHPYGSRLGLASELAELEGYSFAFWVVNGNLRMDLPLEHQFVLTEDLHVQAVFSPDDKHAVLFMDTNGRLLDRAYVEHGEDAVYTGEMPSKPGLELADPMWDKPLENIQDDTVFVVQYDTVKVDTYTVTVINGTGTATVGFNETITVTADAAEPGMHFTHWEIDGQVVSYLPTYTFTPFDDVSIEAMYAEAPLMKIPLVTITEPLGIREDHHTFKGQFYVPEHFDLIEYGMIVSEHGYNLTLDNPDVSRMQSHKHTPQAREWLMSFDDAVFAPYARAYLIVKNTQGETMAFYSETGQRDIDEEVLYKDLSGTEGIAPDGWVYHGVGSQYADESQRLDDTGNYIQTETFALWSEATFTVTFVPKSVDAESGNELVFFDQSSNELHRETIHGKSEISFTITDTNVSQVRIEYNKPGNGNVGIVDVEVVHVLSDPVEQYLVQLTSDEDVALSIDEAGPFYDHGSELTVSADEAVGDLVFSHWEDATTGVVFTYERSHAFAIQSNLHLIAVYTEPVEGLTLNVEANVPGDVTHVDDEGPYALNDEVTLTADAVSGYDFLYWIDLTTSHLIDTDPITTITMRDNRHVRAVYQAVGTVAYSTGFESSTKASYTDGFVSANGESWFFYQALIGAITDDSRIGSRAARLRAGGFIYTDFSVTNPSRLSFNYGNFANDIDLTFHVQFSTNGLKWHTLDTVVSPQGTDMAEYIYDFDLLDLWDTYGIDANTPFYFRIHHVTRIPNSGQSNERLNIDNVEIRTYDDFVGYPLRDYESDLVDFQFDRALLDVYSLGDVWSPALCEAYDTTLGSVVCDVEGSVDTSTRGTYTITYTATDANGTVVEHRVEKTVLTDASLLDLVLDDYDGYYEGLEGLYGEDLLLALRAILWDGAVMPTYDDIRDILQETDAVPGNPDYVYQIYTREEVLADWDARQWDREHIWPNSRLGVMRAAGTNRHAGTDAHNLRPIDSGVNSARGNKYFDTTTTSTSYYIEHDKGDVARVYFYMVTMYDWLVLTDELPPPDSTYSVDGAYQGFLSVLIDWHFLDPVDAFEQNRNEVVFSYQHNRNPFVDYPHFVELIWFDHENIDESP